MSPKHLRTKPGNSMTAVDSSEPHDRYCGADRKQQPGTCTRPAGWGTDHVGLGRCKLHGGKTPIRSGRYSGLTTHRLGDLIAQYEADPDPLNILPELAAARAIFQDFIERYDTWALALLAWHESWKSEEAPAKPLQVLDIADAYRILSEVTKIAERIERIRAANAVSRPDLYRIMGEMGRVVEAHVRDDLILEKIHGDWLSIRVA